MNLQSALMLLIHFVFVFPFLFRYSEEHLRKIELFKNLLTKIGTLLFLYSVLSFLYWRNHPLIFVFLQLLPLLLIRWFAQWARLSLERKVKRYKLFFINNIIHQLILGKSFRSALIESTSAGNQNLGQVFKDIDVNVVFSQQKLISMESETIFFLIRDLRAVAQSSSNELEQLKKLRDSYKMEQNLRHRSRAALSQLRFQMITLVFFALLSLFFQWSFFKKYIHQGAIFWGAVLVLGGLIWGLSLKKQIN